MSEFMNSKTVTTRKPFRCEGCYEKYPAGTRAESVSGRFEGDFLSYKLCMVCSAYLYKHKDDFIDGYEPGSLKKEDPEGWEAVRREMGVGSEQALRSGDKA